MSISSTPVHEGTGAWSSGTSFSVTITAPTNGNCLVLFYCSATIGVTISNISQTGATWVQGKGSNTDRECEIWYALNVSGAGTTVTVNLSGTPLNGAANVSEWSGVATSSALDATNSAFGGSATTVDPGGVTPTASRN